MIQIKEVSVFYNVKKESIKVLNQINFKANNDDICAISGCLGCGKTTFLNVLSGIIKNYEGQVLLNDKMLNPQWYIFALLMNSRIVPLPLHTPKLFENNLELHIIASLYRIIIGLSISIIIGSIVGILMGYFEKLNKMLNPLIYFTYPIPKTALLPVVMTIYGLEDGSKIIIIILITIFPIIVSVRDSVLEIFKSSYDILNSLGASKFQLIKHITIPAILPRI